MSISESRKQEPWELIEYPDSDGKPMADNTKQARWIIQLYNNLRSLFQGQEVFIAADLLWYPEEGHPEISAAPDTMIVFGRPDGDRSSYKQWREEGIAPQVVFEVLSPSNTHIEMVQKQAFYEKYGVQELIVIDPGKKEGEAEKLIPYYRQGNHLVMSVFPIVDWTSKLLGIRFRLQDDKLSVFYPNGSLFRSFEEISAELIETKQQAEIEKQRAETEKQRAEIEKQRAETERQKAEEEKQRADEAEEELAKLRARLKELE